MAGIDNTLIAHVARSLMNCKVSHLTDKLLWLPVKKGELFAYGRDSQVRWPRTDVWYTDVMVDGEEYQKKAMQALQERRDTQPMPASSPEGMDYFTFESHLYEVMMQSAQATGLQEKQVIQRILHGCAEYHLCDAVMTKLRSFPALSELLKYMIGVARDAGVPNGTKVYTQRYLKQFADDGQMPEGYFTQTLCRLDRSVLLSVAEKGRGEKRQYVVAADWDRLMAESRCICLQGEGGMGKSTFLRVLHAAAIQEREKKSSAISAVFHLSLATVTMAMLEAFREKAALFDGSLLWYCVCWGDESYYRSDVVQPEIAGEKRKPVVLLLDGLQEMEDSPELMRCVLEDLERLSRQQGLFVIVTSRLPLSGARLQQAFCAARLTGTPEEYRLRLTGKCKIPQEMEMLLHRPLYYNLFRRLLEGGGSRSAQLLTTRYDLLSCVLEEDVRRQLAAVAEEERVKDVYLLMYVLPKLARRLTQLGKRGLHEADMRTQLEGIALRAAQEPELSRRLCARLADDPQLPELPELPPAERQLMYLLEFGWLVIRDGLCTFCHQEHQDFLTARLLRAELLLTGESCLMSAPGTLPEVQLNQPAAVIDMLREGLFRDGVAEGLAACAGYLPQVQYADELTPPIIACAEALRQLAEYMRLPVREHAGLLLTYLRRVTDCLEDVDETETEQPPELLGRLRGVLQKTVQLMRLQGDYAPALKLLEGWDASLPLRHAKAKLLLEYAMSGGGTEALREGLGLLQECAGQEYYFSCSLQGMLLSAPHPLPLREGLLRRDCVLAAAVYLRGCRDAAHQGYDVVYIVRNLLTMIFCGRVAVPERLRLSALLEAPEEHLQPGNGEYLRRTPRCVQELLERVDRYDRSRCALVQGCCAANAALQGRGDAAEAAEYLRLDGGLLAQTLLWGLMGRDAAGAVDYLKPLKAADGSFLTAEQILNKPLDQYSPVWQYLDAKRLAQSFDLPVDFAALEALLPGEVRELIALCSAA